MSSLLGYGERKPDHTDIEQLRRDILNLNECSKYRCPSCDASTKRLQKALDRLAELEAKQ